MFKGCRCRIFIKKYNKVYHISSIHWESDKLTSINYIDPENTPFVRYHTIEDGDILMNSIGQFDKNGKEIWAGDIVKYDPNGHGNYILGVIVYDLETTRFIIEQLTNTRDYFHTCTELDEQFNEYCKQYPENKISGSVFQFDSPTNWYNVLFYDALGPVFSYSDLEVVGDIYTNSTIVSEKQKHLDYMDGGRK